MLLYGILHAFLKRITRFITGEDPLPPFVELSRGKLLLYLYNDLCLCKRKILPNIWSIIAQHKYKQIDQIIKQSKKNVKELLDTLLRQYLHETIDPVVESIESNLYSGRFDFNDCSPPTTIRNYVKLIITSLLGVHSELFLINKSLISVVFDYAVKQVYTKLLLLFSKVPRFGTNAAVQTYMDVFCLRDVFRIYNKDDTKEIIQSILKMIPGNSFEQHKPLMTRLISEFQRTMQPHIAVLQQQPPPSSVSLSFMNDSSSPKQQQQQQQPQQPPQQQQQQQQQQIQQQQTSPQSPQRPQSQQLTPTPQQRRESRKL